MIPLDGLAGPGVEANGFRPGRQILLTRPETTIGRAESCDIGLFGDPAVERLHARITREVLQGRKGPKRDIVCLNAAPALVAGRKAKTLQEGFRLAAQVIDSGAAAEKLARLVAVTSKARPHDPVQNS